MKGAPLDGDSLLEQKQSASRKRTPTSEDVARSKANGMPDAI